MNQTEQRRSILKRGRFRWGMACTAVMGAFATIHAGSVSAQGLFDDLLVRVPPSANALMVIDCKAVFSSPIAIKQGWKNRHRAAYVKKPFLLPPECDRLVLASQMNPNNDFAEAWELGVMSLNEVLTMRSIAKAEGGYVDQIGGLSAVWTPSNAYFVAVDRKVLGVMHPAHRQAVARWAKYSKSNHKVAIVPYLKKAVGAVQGSTQIVMALDLADAVRPHKLQEGLRESPLTRGKPAKQKEWAAIISGIQGVTFKVQLRDAARGTMQIDFASSPAVFGSDAKTLVLNVMDKYGVGLDDMQKWTAKITGNSIVLTGPLSGSGMRMVFSLLELPTSKFSSLKDESTVVKVEDKKQTVIKASQAYYQSVSTLLDDLRKKFATNRDARRNMAPTYMERYGRRIDRLPILNVDEELLAYGASVSATLRGSSVTTRKAGVSSGIRKSQIYGNYQYNYDGYGYYSTRSSASARYQVSREELGRARQARFKSWKEIEDATSQIRIRMTGKYKARF